MLHASKLQNTQLSVLFNVYLAFSLLGAWIPVPTKFDACKYFLAELMYSAWEAEDRLGGDRGDGLSIHSSSHTGGTVIRKD